MPNGPVGHSTVRVYLAGGVPEVMLHLRELGLLDLTCLTVTGEPLGKVLDWWAGSERRKRLRDRLTEADGIDPDEAYSDAVDQLLDSPQFGERWAQHWLDVIRWAETNGSEANLYRKNAWVYRDYVIRSFNDDKPYDQFLREQIAGDRTGVGEATGFLVAGPHVPPATVGREPVAAVTACHNQLAT